MNASLSSTIQDYWDIAVRRKWLVVGAIVISLGISWTLCKVLPKSYRSTTLILVENQKIPERYVQGVVEGTVQDRLNLIQQQVMSHSALTQVIEEFKLDRDDAQRETREALMGKVRKSIKVEIKGGGRGRVDAFSISFAHEDPMTAKKVTARLASQFIEVNLRTREQLVEGASEFLDLELRSAKETVELKEQAIGDFKRKYMGELPGQLEANLRTLDRLQGEVPSIHEAMNNQNERLAAAKKAITDYQKTGTITQPGQAGRDVLLARLKELKRNLATLSAEYKGSYPDILLLKQEIRQVKAQLAGRDVATEEEKIPDTEYGDSPAAATVDPYLQGLKKTHDEINAELEKLKNRLNRITAQTKEYEGRVERTPAREQELMILVRDYENMQRNYQSLLDKRLNARVAGNLEKRQKGEQFRILDTANLPGTPEWPDPLRIMLAGLALGCGIGYGSAFALEILNPSFRRPEDAEETLGCPVLAEIPTFELAYAESGERLLPAPSATDGSPTPRLLQGGQASEGIQSARGTFPRGACSTSRWNTSAGRLAPELNLVSRWSALSVVAEQFRVAATRIVLMGAERTSTVLVVTSAVKGEGKSSTLVNLGYVLSHDLGKSTLIIDGDLKQPVMHTFAGVPFKPGLAELLHGDQPLDRCLRRLGESSLWIMPAGSIRSRPVDLAKMNQLSGILTELRPRFEYILVDAPPVLPLADMNVLSGLADVLVLVVRAGSTGRDVVSKALKKLEPAAPMGIILTGSWVDRMPYYARSYNYLEAGKARES